MGGVVGGGSVWGGAVSGAAVLGAPVSGAEVSGGAVVADVAGADGAVVVGVAWGVAAEDRPGSVSATATERTPADSTAPAVTHRVARESRSRPRSRSNSFFTPIQYGESERSGR